MENIRFSYDSKQSNTFSPMDSWSNIIGKLTVSWVLIDFLTLYQSFTSFRIGLFRSTSGYINQLGFCFVIFLTYYSVGCQTKSLSNLSVRFIMFTIFLAILKFCTIQRPFYFTITPCSWFLTNSVGLYKKVFIIYDHIKVFPKEYLHGYR